jgi:cytoskeletal protein RodZ
MNMDLNNLLKKIEKVEAPSDFEQKVKTELSLRKRAQTRNMRLRLSFAGAFSAAAILLVIVGLFVLPERRPAEIASVEKSAPQTVESQDQRRTRDYIPIVEAVDYTGEIRTLQDQPPTIYILEHVSDSTDTKIIY